MSINGVVAAGSLTATDIIRIATQTRDENASNTERIRYAKMIRREHQKIYKTCIIESIFFISVWASLVTTYAYVDALFQCLDSESLTETCTNEKIGTGISSSILAIKSIRAIYKMFHAVRAANM